MKEEILRHAAQFRGIIEHLRKKSDYFPSVYREDIDEFVYLSTLVRIKREGKWYKVHHVEKYHFSTRDIGRPYLKFIRNIYCSQLLWVKTNFDTSWELDEHQVEEVKRIKNLTNYESKRRTDY